MHCISAKTAVLSQPQSRIGDVPLLASGPASYTRGRVAEPASISGACRSAESPPTQHFWGSFLITWGPSSSTNSLLHSPPDRRPAISAAPTSQRLPGWMRIRPLSSLCQVCVEYAVRASCADFRQMRQARHQGCSLGADRHRVYDRAKLVCYAGLHSPRVASPFPC
jgi:hypothetical protein